VTMNIGYSSWETALVNGADAVGTVGSYPPSPNRESASSAGD
jgi:hypothetical protein